MMQLLQQIRAAVRAHGGTAGSLPHDERNRRSSPQGNALAQRRGHRPFPVALDPFTCNRFRDRRIRDRRWRWTLVLGVFCGAGRIYRALAEAVGKHPPASQYSADMSKHAFLVRTNASERCRRITRTSFDCGAGHQSRRGGIPAAMS